MTKKMLTKKKDPPAAIVRGAYNLEFAPESAKRLAEIEKYAAYIIEQAQLAAKVAVKDEVTNSRANELVVNLTKARKGLEDLKKYFTTPLEKNKKKIIAVIKALGADGLGQEDRLRREIGEYFTVKENRRREAEAERQAKEEAAQRKAARLGRSAPKPLSTGPIEETVRKVETEHGSGSVNLVWGYDLEDLDKVPRQYLKVEVNKRAVDAAISGGVREIPGLKIGQKPRMAVR